MSDDLAPYETLDLLIGGWSLFQLRDGHRMSTDDHVCAWRASVAAPGARRLLDLGCGFGSVGLSVLHRLWGPGVHLTAVEAQEVSASLARRTVVANGLSERVDVVHGDLRDPAVLPDGARYDLITGTPPYLPADAGNVSPNPHKAACRLELRGGLLEYATVARRVAAPGARFVFAMAASDPRVETAPIEAGWVVLERWDYVFRPGAPPRVTTVVCARADEAPHPPRRTGGMALRGPDGGWSARYRRFRRAVREGPAPAQGKPHGSASRL